MKILLCLVAAAALLSPAYLKANENDEVRRATLTIKQFRQMPETAIPTHVLRDARGVAVIRVYKAAFGVSGQMGSGVLLARSKRGWSGPVFISTGGAGFGPQVGAQATDYVLILNTDEAVDAFARRTNITLGVDVSIAAGPVGRAATAGVTPVAAIYSYSRSQGLFVGASIQGAVVGIRSDSNTAFYGHDYSPSQILRRQVTPPKAAKPLIASLKGRLEPIAEH